MLGHWNDVGGPFADGLNAATKYVVSSQCDTELPWPQLRAGQWRRSRPDRCATSGRVGSGLRLFGTDASAHTFELVQSHASASGVLMVCYQRS